MGAPYRQLGMLIGSFALTTLIARPFADGWGVAAGIGQIAFVLVLVAILLRAD